MSGALTADALTDGLGTRVIGRRVHCLDRCPSTNERAWHEIAHRAHEGTVIVAEEQTRGRGRLGRTWFSPRGAGVWMSVVLRPELPVYQFPLLTSMGAVAVAAAIASTTSVPPRLRWPNDVVVSGRKVAGVLAETRDLRGRRPAAVLGIGVNVNVTEEQFPKEIRAFATSLSIASGSPVDRLRLARALLQELDHLYAELTGGEVEAFCERWRSLLDHLSERVRVKVQGRWHVGRIVDVDPIEGIFLRSDAGPPLQYRAEHVEMLRPLA